MKLFLLDRDGVVVVNRPTNIKTPEEIELIEGVPEAIAALNGAGYKVAICTNQAEIGRGVLTPQQVRRVHEALVEVLRERGAEIGQVFCCGTVAKSPFKKPGGGMLRDAIKIFGASPHTTFSATRKRICRLPTMPDAGEFWCARAWAQKLWQQAFPRISNRWK
jgi:D-glycero-D-manno-heptose 1,7-bisphosphate phosphatase